MSKPFVAHTQHNDLTGTIALDGRTSVTETLAELAKLCNVPTEFVPVGFYLSGVDHAGGIAEFEVAAVEGTIETVANHIHAAHPSKKLMVRRFPGTMNLGDLPKYFKMLSIAVLLTQLHERNVKFDPC